MFNINHISSEENQVWKVMYQHHIDNAITYADEHFFTGLRALGLEPNGYPTAQQLQQNLATIGWSLYLYNNAVIPPSEWFYHLSQRCFPITTKIRSLSEIYFSESPDAFHDIFGHLPFLFCEVYRDSVLSLAKLYTRYSEPEIRLFLNRVYFYLFEFGVVGDINQPKIFGAGFITSKLETAKLIQGDIFIKDFDIQHVAKENIMVDGVVDSAYRLDYISQLTECVDMVKSVIESGLPMPQSSASSAGRIASHLCHKGR